MTLIVLISVFTVAAVIIAMSWRTFFVFIYCKKINNAQVASTQVSELVKLNTSRFE